LRHLIEAAVLDHSVSGGHPDLSTVSSGYAGPDVTKPVDTDPVCGVSRYISE
jgi:hypothetical protein